MTHTALFFLFDFLAASFVLLSAANIFGKLYVTRKETLNRESRNNVKSALDGFLNDTEERYREGLTEFVRNTHGKDRNYLAVVDSYLTEILELPNTGYRGRLIDIAAQMGFPGESRTQIRNRNHRISAEGIHRAGLYNVTEAVKDMEAALDSFPSENQFDILMGLARTGGAEALKGAFEKIKKSIMVNERGIIEILSIFPNGDEKEEFFRRMIHSDTNYIISLFLKATNKEMAKALMDDIIRDTKDGNKEVRAAAVKSLATLGGDAPADILIEALKDKEWEVRALAAKALGPVSNPKASAVLFAALFDQQWWVRQNAANALASHPGFETLFILAAESGDEYARDSILSVLENGSNPVFQRSIKIMAV